MYFSVVSFIRILRFFAPCASWCSFAVGSERGFYHATLTAGYRAQQRYEVAIATVGSRRLEPAPINPRLDLRLN